VPGSQRRSGAWSPVGDRCSGAGCEAPSIRARSAHGLLRRLGRSYSLWSLPWTRSDAPHRELLRNHGSERGRLHPGDMMANTALQIFTPRKRDSGTGHFLEVPRRPPRRRRGRARKKRPIKKRDAAESTSSR
jgi:hypothetical protein